MMINKSFRTRVIFQDQEPKKATEGSEANNFEWTTQEKSLLWIEKSTSLFGNFRSLVRSIYIRWSITINALSLAKKRYETHPELLLYVKTLRPINNNFEYFEIASWEGLKAAQNHEMCIPLMAGYALQDLYGFLEEIIFTLYLTLVEANPLLVLCGQDDRLLKRLLKRREESPEDNEKFEEQWKIRLKKWKLKKSREGLHSVFLSYWRAANLEYIINDYFDIKIWCLAINILAEIRNSITHGENNVSEKLASLCQQCFRLDFKYVAGDPLEFTLSHLMVVEGFLDEFLTILNLSLCELGVRKEEKMWINAKAPSHTSGHIVD